MKKIIVTVSLILLELTAAKADGTPHVNNRIQQTLNKEFPGCESVKWLKVEECLQATFVFHESLLVAYFNEEGDLLGAARNIIVTQLPLSALHSFDKHFANFDIVEILEITNEEGMFYWLTLEKVNKKYHAKVNANGEMLVFAAIKKKK